VSQANVSFVQSLYAAFGRGDIAAIVAAMAPQSSWRIVGRKEDHPLLGERKGGEGVQEFFTTLSQVQEATEFSPREFYPSGDKVFVLGRYGWKMRTSGKSLATDFCHIFTVADGKVRSFVEFTDTAKFAEAYRG
jgi:ketosteroid isomerase-like protein